MMTIDQRRLFGFPFLILLLIAILFSAEFSSSTLACSCKGPGPVCELIVGTKAIFLGESVELVSDPNTGAPQFYRFRVERAYKGLPPDTKAVEVYAEGACGTSYPTGKRYIVFGYNEAKKPLAVMSGMCSGSRLADRNQADIDFLENYAKGKTETAVFGKVVQGGTFYSKSEDEISPLSGVEVVLENDDQRFVAFTQSNGSYRFSSLPAGKYRLSARLESYNLDKTYEEVSVESGGCNEVYIAMKSRCGISGVLLDDKGEPAVKKRVEILRRNPGGEWYSTPRMWKTTDSKGAFDFSDIDSGEYLLGYEIRGGRPSDNSPYPTVYYPGVDEIGNAQIITLAPGQKRNGLKIKLPAPHTERQVTIRVIMPDGSLPGKNLLQVFSKGGGLLKNLEGKNSDGGVVLFTAYQEREYEFRARYWVDNLGTGTPVFTKRLLVAEPVKLSPGKDAAEVTLILSREIKDSDEY